MSINGYRILFKRVGDQSAIDSYATYNVVLEDMPDIPLEPKNIFTQDWYDQDGNDVYIPATLKYKAAECKFKFIAKNDGNTSVKSVYNSFVNYLEGKMFSFYCEYNTIGKQNVRLVKKPEEAEYFKNVKRVLNNGSFTDVTEEVLKFSLVFEINDTKTDITLSL